ncbi:MAG: hypothetical protein KF905_00880 [Flavobacteriales bacterium]|nr:hypothetical protein [Flavobacteriales bacterium]
MAVDIKTTIAWCAGVAAACISGTYVFTGDRLRSELEQYKQAEAWNLPELLRDLGGISSTLNEQLVENKEYERLKAFESDHKMEFERLQKEASLLRSRLEAVEGASVFLRESQTVPLGEPGLLMALDNSNYRGITLRVASKTFTLQIAEQGFYNSSTTKYTFTFKGQDDQGAEVLIIKEPIK